MPSAIDGVVDGVVARAKSASITRLVTKPEKLQAEQAAEFKRVVQAGAAQLDLPLPVVQALTREIDRRTRSSSNSSWRFVMVNPEGNSAIVDWLCAHSSRPLVAVRLWSTMLAHLDFDNGEVLLTRDQMAEIVHESPENISRILTELETIRAISRRRERVPGMRGPGVTRVYVNPMTATHLAGALRDAAQSKAGPLLTLMEGGAEPG